MNEVSKVTAAGPALLKFDPTAPVLVVTGRETIAIAAGTTFNGRCFDVVTPVAPPAHGFKVGADYMVALTAGGDAPQCVRATLIPSGDDVIGGFHFAPGGNAAARAGGDEIPQINPCS